MVGQSELFPPPNKFIPTTELVELLISFLNLSIKSRVLVIEFGNQVSNLALSEGHEVIQIPSYENLEEQIANIKANAPYDGAIIFPAFSVIQANIEPPEGWHELKRTFTEDWLLAYAINHLSLNGTLVALVPNGLLSNYGRKGLRRGLIERGLVVVATIPQDLLYRDYKQTSTGLIVLQRNYTTLDRQIGFVDCMDYDSLPSTDFWHGIMNGKFIGSDSVVRTDIQDFKEDYRLDPQYYDRAYLQIKPPPGYVEVSLGEIADIRGGTPVDKKYRSEIKSSETSIPYLQVRHILSSGEIADKVFWVEPTIVSDIETRLAMPEDILVTVAGTVGKVAQVSNNYGSGVLFDTSIRRVRIYSDSINPHWVFQFFQSEIGQLQFRRMTSGTAIPQITSPILEAMPIFLPASYEEPTNTPIEEPKPSNIAGAEAQANLIADALQENVIEYLRKVKPNETEWKENIEKTLRSLIEDLFPKPLAKVILEDFPAPIAIPFRRFEMARYNHYERLDRMVNLVESCIYFVFHVLLADYCIHGWHTQINLSREAKQALKGWQSVDYRLDFINEICEAAQNGSVTLFIPELVNSEIVQIGQKLRIEVRNPISHSAPGSEPYVRSLIDQYMPSVNKLLESLRFLDNYTLCRIRSHYFQNGEWHYQAEVYRGAEYDLNIQESSMPEASSEDKLITAERDHLIILSPDEETLDIFPFYQLYFGNETSRESHLCFYKYRQGSRLIGESIRSGVEIALSGIEDFQSLTGVNIGNNDQDN